MDEFSVLVVDDDDAVRRLIEAILIDVFKGEGDIETFSDGTTALERIVERNFDLAILDIDLPGVDGITLGREFRLRNALGGMIHITGGDLKYIKQKNAADLLFLYAKPFDVREFARAIRMFRMCKEHRVEKPGARM